MKRVNTIVMAGKVKRKLNMRAKMKQTFEKQPDWKKAIVELEPGDFIGT